MDKNKDYIEVSNFRVYLFCSLILASIFLVSNVWLQELQDDYHNTQEKNDSINSSVGYIPKNLIRGNYEYDYTNISSPFYFFIEDNIMYGCPNPIINYNGYISCDMDNLFQIQGRKIK